MATATAAAGPEQVEALDQVLPPTEIDSRADSMSAAKGGQMTALCMLCI